MSKIGKKPILIPPGVEVKINGSSLAIKGQKGELQKSFDPSVSFEMHEGKLNVKAADSALWGLSRALASNMITGVSAGFQKVLEFTGVGYKAQVKGDVLELSIGFTNPVLVNAPAGVTFRVEKNSIMVEGPDREAVGHAAAQIRAARPPEPYKGSGIKYREEVIRRKAGKKAATATAV